MHRETQKVIKELAVETQQDSGSGQKELKGLQLELDMEVEKEAEFETGLRQNGELQIEEEFAVGMKERDELEMVRGVMGVKELLEMGKKFEVGRKIEMGIGEKHKLELGLREKEKLEIEEEFESGMRERDELEMSMKFQLSRQKEQTKMGLELEVEVEEEEEEEEEEELELNTHSAVRYHWWIWQLMGLMQPPGMSRLQFLTRSLFINVLVTLLFPLTLLAKLIFTTSLQELCENLTITITDIVANLKFINVFLVRRQLREIQDILLVLDQRAKRVHNEQELEVLQEAVSTAQSSFRTFAGIFVFGTALSCFRVAIARNRQLLYPAWFGVDWQCNDLAYVLIYVYQLIGLIVQAMQDCANDSYPPAYLCILTGHMRALELRVRRIGYTQPMPHTSNSRLKHQWISYLELCDCIEDYINIQRLHVIIQKILSIACMAQLVCSAAVQCTVAMHFLYVADSNDLSAMILSLVFFTAVTLEVFIICYFGDRMRTQSEALLDAFYDCNWLDQLPQFKRNLIITLMRTQKPCYIYAGGYIAITLETFVQVNRLTYSVFTLLLRAK